MSNNEQLIGVDKMNSKKNFRSALPLVAFLMVSLLVFTQNASALELTPARIQESEGTVVPLKIIISANDWMKPDTYWSNRCADIGVGANFVARYILKRTYIGSATFGGNQSSGDLHLSYSGQPSNDLYLMWCSPATSPGIEWDTLSSIHLHEDDVPESTEIAYLELWSLDFDDNETFVSSIGISIFDAETIENTNACSSTPLPGDTAVATGSISTADCDDSPRGSGFLADTFTFSGTQGDDITIHANWGNMDGYLYLEAPDGSIEDSNDDFNATSDSQIEHVLNQTGTYTVWATTKDKNNSGDYEISLTRKNQGCTSRVLECGGTVVGNLLEGSCAEGPLGSNHYAEKFTFVGEAGATFWLNTNWDFDGYLLLKNPLGRVVAENDNYLSSSDSRIEYTPQEDGTYTIWATSHLPYATGAYDVLLDCESPVGPDLTVDAPEVQAELVMPGQSLPLSARVYNSGNRPSDSTTLHYVLSSDARIDRADPELGSAGAPGLAVGESSKRSTVLVAPVTAGQYWLGVCAEQVTDEASLSNNCSAGRRIEVMAQSECTTRTISCGELLSGSLDSQDCSRSPRGTGFLAEVLEVDVAAGGTLIADASWLGVDGYLILEDSSGVVVASNDDAEDAFNSRIEFAVQDSGIHRIWTTSLQRGANGSYELELMCGSASAPDLVASEVLVSASDVIVEGTVDLSAVVFNDGKSASDPGQVHFMLSSDEQISPDDTILESLDLSALAAGAELVAETSVKVPAEAGHYWLGICVDTVINESLTWNNCSHIDAAESQSLVQADPATSTVRPSTSTSNAGTLIRVSTGGDCASTSMTCGQNISGTLGQNNCDLGPRGTAYFADSYTFSGNAGDSVSLNIDWTGLDGYLYLEDPDGELAAENDDFSDAEHSRLEHVLEHTGSYRVWPSAYAQGQGGTYELSLDCNPPSGPDLSVDVPQLSETFLRPGQNLSLSTLVVNQGEEFSDATSVRFILASSSVLSASDRVLGKSDVSALAPGDFSLESLSMAVDVAPGTYWAATCVDTVVLELNDLDNCALSGPITVEQNIRPIDINSGLNDAWFNPDTSGQGFFISVLPDGNEMFLSWFTYDIDRPETSVPFELGDPGHRWLTALGAYERGVATLDIYLNQGGVFDQSLPAPTESLYGSMSVSFSDCSHGQIEFDIPSVGERGTIPISRVAPDNAKDCEAKTGIVETQSYLTLGQVDMAETVTVSAFNLNAGLNDAWYNPDTNGQGFSFNVFPHQGSAFLSWFTYDTELRPEDVPYQLGTPGLRWLTALGNFQGDSAELTLYRVDGGVFNSASPVPEEAEYGNITVRFDDCNSGELQYDIPSLLRQGVVPIQRIAPDGVPVCEQAQVSLDEDVLNVSPGNKDMLENFCGGASSWDFNWPDVPGASGYVFELWRDDALIPMTFNVSESEFHYQKTMAVPAEHLIHWRWRYQPQFSSTGKMADFTQLFTFDVGMCEQ